jgi:hypothetical protein
MATPAPRARLLRSRAPPEFGDMTASGTMLRCYRTDAEPAFPLSWATLQSAASSETSPVPAIETPTANGASS